MELTPEGLATARIRAQKIAKGSFTPQLRLAGTIVGDPTHIAQVGARVTGRVSAVRVTVGERVKKGQTLIEVDTVEIHKTELELRTGVARSRAADDVLARQKQLVDERVGAVQELRRAESDATTARAELAEAREHLRFLGLSESDVDRVQAGSGESNSRVTSPIDGRVSSMSVTLGQVLGGTETVVTVADLDPIWGALRVYERDLATIRASAAAVVEVPTYPGRKFEGKVSFVSDVLEPASRSAEVRVRRDNADTSLRPGMSAHAFTRRAKDEETVWLPVGAVQRHNGVPVVFVRRAERRFEATKVTVGAEEGGFLPLEAAFALRGELERAALAGD